MTTAELAAVIGAQLATTVLIIGAFLSQVGRLDKRIDYLAERLAAVEAAVIRLEEQVRRLERL